MLSWIKFLKIMLPVATVATATVATVSLVSFRKADEKRNADDENKVLDDFELQAKEFEEKTMLYSKDGQNEPVTLENDALKDKILEKFKEGGELGDLAQGLPDADKLQKLLSEIKDKNVNSNIPQQDSTEANSGENVNLPNQSEPKVKELIQNDKEGPDKENIDVGGTQSEDGLDPKQEDLDVTKEQAPEASGDTENQDNLRENDKDIVQEEGTKGLDLGNNVEDNPQLKQDSEINIDNSKTQEDTGEDVKVNLDETQGLQVKEDQGGDSSEKLGSEDSKDSSQDDSETRSQQSNQDVDGKLDNDEINGGGDTATESSEGKKILSPDEVKHWEDLLNTVGDVATQLQLLVIDKN